MKEILISIDRITQALGPDCKIMITEEPEEGILIRATKYKINTPLRYQRLFTRREIMDVQYTYQLIDIIQIKVRSKKTRQLFIQTQTVFVCPFIQTL